MSVAMRHGFRLALGVVVMFAALLSFSLAAAWLVDRGVIPRALAPHSLMLGAAGMLGVLYLILHAARRQLRNRFRARPAPTYQQWYAEHYDDEDDVSPETAERILTLVARGIGGGVQPTQVLPSDRLDEDFTFRLWGTAIDDGAMLGHPLVYLNEWLQQQGGEEYESTLNWKTIDDVIRQQSKRAIIE